MTIESGSQPPPAASADTADARRVPELDVIEQMERAVIAGDADAASRFLLDDIRYRVGSFEAVVGIDAVIAYIERQSQHARWIGHDVHGSWSIDGTVIVEVDSRFERVSDGSPIVLPCTDIYRFEDGRIADWRVYADLRALGVRPDD